MTSRQARLMTAAALLMFACGSLGAEEGPKKPPPSAESEGQRPFGEDGAGKLPDAPGAERDPELIDPGPEGCPFNDRRLELIV